MSEIVMYSRAGVKVSERAKKPTRPPLSFILFAIISLSFVCFPLVCLLVFPFYTLVGLFLGYFVELVVCIFCLLWFAIFVSVVWLFVLVVLLLVKSFFGLVNRLKIFFACR